MLNPGLALGILHLIKLLLKNVKLFGGAFCVLITLVKSVTCGTK